MVRLSGIERDALSYAVRDLDAEVYVFGSRTSPGAKGGDVDLLVIPRRADFSPYRLSQRVTLDFQKVCEEKVDVVVFPRAMNAEQAAFFRTISKVRVK